MRWILFLLAGLALFDGAITYTNATTIFQQIAGLLAILGCAVLFAGAAIVDGLVGLKNEIKKISGPAEELAKLKEKVRQSKPLGSGDQE